MASTGFSSRPGKQSKGDSADHGFTQKDQADLNQVESAKHNSTAKPDASAASGKNYLPQKSTPQKSSEIEEVDAPEPQAETPSETTETKTPSSSDAPSQTQAPKSEAASNNLHRSHTPSSRENSPAGRTAASQNALPEISSLADAAGAAGGASPMGRLGKSIGFVGKHRKAFMAGGGLAGIILALVIGFFTFLPLKLETMLKSIMVSETARMNHYVTRRVDAIVFRYLYERTTGTLAADGFYVGKGPIRTLFGNMQLNKFEKKLEDKGIKLTKTGSSSVKITSNGTDLRTVNSASEMANFFDNDLAGKQARAAIKVLVHETYPGGDPLSFLKRRHLRKYVRNAYNIRRWNIKKQEDKKDPANPDRPGSTVLDIQSNTIDPAEDITISSVNCATGTGECPDTEHRNNPDGSSKLHPPTDPALDRATETATIDTTKKGLRESYKALKEATTKTIQAGVTKIFGVTIANTIFDTVPIIGWLSIGAELDKFFWSGSLRQIAIMLHSAQYAAVAMTWSSLADQAKAGELTASQLNEINKSLDNIETSNAVQRIFFEKPDSGVMVANEKRVGSDTGSNTQPAKSEGFPTCDIGWFDKYGNTFPTSGDPLDYFTFAYRRASSSPMKIHTPLCLIEPPLKLISDGIGALLGMVLDPALKVVVDGVNALGTGLTGQPFDVMAMAQQAIGWMLNQVWTPVATGRETGADLGNAIDAGWDVTSNQMCRDVLGCKNISLKQASAQQTQIIAENNADIASRGILASLFSTDSPQTFGSQMIAMMPTKPSTALARIGTFSASLLTNPMHYMGAIASSISSPTHAAAAVPLREPNGVQQTGYDESQVNDFNLQVPTVDIAGPIGPDGNPTGPDGRINEYDCPVISDATQTNQCLLDTAAAQALCASFSSDDDGGLGGNGTPGDCSDSSAPTAAVTPAQVLANQSDKAPKPFSFWGFIHWGAQ